MEVGPFRADAPELRQSFAGVLRLRPFAVLFSAETQSIVGDQLARVALAVLVFHRTDSAAATALTYAATFLPAIAGGVVLAGLADRYSRRVMMVLADLLRAGMFAAMALPHMTLSVDITLLVIAVFVSPAHSAAQVSALAEFLDEEQFRVASGLRLATNQCAQIAGFATGGLAVAALGSRGALALDSATFLVSAALIGALLPWPPRSTGTRSTAKPPRAGGMTWRSRPLQMLIGLCWLAGFFVVPEGLAVPFGRSIGASTTQTGLLMAAIPFGSALGAVLVVRLVPRRHRLLVSQVMAVAAGLPLLVSAAKPSLALALAAWTVSGFFSAYLMEVTSAIVQAVPPALRARYVGRISAGLITAQGVGIAVFGVVTRWTDAGRSIALAGAMGAALAIVLSAYGGRPHGAGSPSAVLVGNAQPVR